MEAAFFDLDKTVISRASSLVAARPMYRAGLVSRSALLRSGLAQLVYLVAGADERQLDRVKDRMLALTRGWEREHVERVVREEILDAVDPFVYAEAVALMQLHRAIGRKVFIVSSAPEEIVRPLADRLGAADVVATRAEVVEGRYTGNVAFYCFGEAKADAIREIARREDIRLLDSYAYSDSLLDLPMLEAVGQPVVVNPGRELRKLAERRGWEVRSFRRAVRVRQRMPHVPAASRNAAAVAASTLAGIAVVWVFLRPRLARLLKSLSRPPRPGLHAARLARSSSFGARPVSCRRPRLPLRRCWHDDRGQPFEHERGNGGRPHVRDPAPEEQTADDVGRVVDA